MHRTPISCKVCGMFEASLWRHHRVAPCTLLYYIIAVGLPIVQKNTTDPTLWYHNETVPHGNVSPIGSMVVMQAHYSFPAAFLIDIEYRVNQHIMY